MDFQNEPIKIEKLPNGVKVSLMGSIHTNTSWIESEIKKVIDLKPQLVELNLSETTYLSSWGVGLLVWLHNEVGKIGGSVVVTSVRKKVLQTLHYARLESLLKVAPSAVVDP